MVAEHGHTFHVADYVLFVLMLVGSLGIGLYSGLKGRKNTTSSYLMGNRELGLIPVTLSLTVSIVSSNTLLGTPTEAYGFGAQYAFIGIGSTVAGILIALTFVPLIYPIKLISIHQYLQIRFKSRCVQWYGTTMLLIMQVLYVGTVIFGPATALEIATGMPTWGSLVMVSVIGTLYTAIGGMKAVVWTDAFQAIIMVAGMLTVIIVGTVKVGSPSKVWEINDEWGRLFVSFDADPTNRMTFWALTVGGVFFFFAIYAANQPCMQRTCALSTLTSAKWSMVLTGPLFALLALLSVGAGMVAFAYYQQRECDPIRANYLTNSNQIIPYFVMEVLSYPGLPGIYFACLFSGSLSSLSSSINSMTAVVWEDILKGHFDSVTEERKTIYAKILSVLFGILSLAVSFFLLYVGGTLIQIALSIIGATLGPVVGVFVLGGLIPWANWIGALSGGIVSVTVTMWMLLGQTLHSTQTQSLPTTTEDCHLYKSIIMEIQAILQSIPMEILNSLGNKTSEYQDVTTSSTLLSGNITSTGASTEDDNGLSGVLEWMYSVAFMWYSLIGVFLVLLVGIPVSFATGATDPKEVHPCLLFPCLRRAKMYKSVSQEDYSKELEDAGAYKQDKKNKSENQPKPPKYSKIDSGL